MSVKLVEMTHGQADVVIGTFPSEVEAASEARFLRDDFRANHPRVAFGSLAFPRYRIDPA